MNFFNREPKEYTLKDPDWNIYSNIIDPDTRINPIKNEVNRIFALHDGDRNNNLDR